MYTKYSVITVPFRLPLEPMVIIAAPVELKMPVDTPEVLVPIWKPAPSMFTASVPVEAKTYLPAVVDVKLFVPFAVKELLPLAEPAMLTQFAEAVVTLSVPSLSNEASVNEILDLLAVTVLMVIVPPVLVADVPDPKVILLAENVLPPELLFREAPVELRVTSVTEKVPVLETLPVVAETPNVVADNVPLLLRLAVPEPLRVIPAVTVNVPALARLPVLDGLIVMVLATAVTSPLAIVTALLVMVTLSLDVGKVFAVQFKAFSHVLSTVPKKEILLVLVVGVVM